MNTLSCKYTVPKNWKHSFNTAVTKGEPLNTNGNHTKNPCVCTGNVGKVEMVFYVYEQYNVDCWDEITYTSIRV